MIALLNLIKQWRAARIYKQAISYFAEQERIARSKHKATKDIARARQAWLHDCLRGSGYAE